jgi:hypothetical protein
LARCSGIKRDGGRCKGRAIEGSSYCYNHHPDKAAQRRRNTAKGGRTAGRGRPSSELRRLQAEFEQLKRRLEDPKDKLHRGDAAVMGQLLHGARACIRDLLAAREQEELVERMEALEAALEARKRGPGYGA